MVGTVTFENLDGDTNFLPGVVYLDSDPNEPPHSAHMLCPCGCDREPLHLNFIHSISPRWIPDRETGSLFPSVQLTTGCRSHFWIRNGSVEWCR